MCSFYIHCGVKLEGFMDTNLGGDFDTRKITSRFVFTINSTIISWMS